MTPDLRACGAALRVVKRPVAVRVVFAREAGVCATLEGEVGYRAGDAVLTAQTGESWPVGRESFLASYVPDPPVRAGEDGVYRKRPIVSLALRLRAPMTVKVGWRDDPLDGKVGDWLLQYADGTYGVVADAIFRDTYVMADT